MAKFKTPIDVLHCQSQMIFCHGGRTCFRVSSEKICSFKPLFTGQRVELNYEKYVKNLSNILLQFLSEYETIVRDLKGMNEDRIK